MVDQSIESVVVLGTIALIRVVLSFSLEAEIDGMWPWNRWRVPPDKPLPDESLPASHKAVRTGVTRQICCRSGQGSDATAAVGTSAVARTPAGCVIGWLSDLRVAVF